MRDCDPKQAAGGRHCGGGWAPSNTTTGAEPFLISELCGVLWPSGCGKLG